MEALSPADLRAEFTARASALEARIISTDLRDVSIALFEAVGPESSEGVGVSSQVKELLPQVAELERETGDWPEVMVSRAMLAIGATGGVGVAEVRRRDRLMALLCVRHIVLLPAGLIVPSIAEAAPFLRHSIEGSLRYLTFVSGPSRTSDIERVLTVGVHGPRELVVILVDGWDPAID